MSWRDDRRERDLTIVFRYCRWRLTKFFENLKFKYNLFENQIQVQDFSNFDDLMWARSVRQIRYSELWICDNVKLLYKDKSVNMRRLIDEKISFTNKLFKYSNTILESLISLKIERKDELSSSFSQTVIFFNSVMVNNY